MGHLREILLSTTALGADADPTGKATDRSMLRLEKPRSTPIEVNFRPSNVDRVISDIIIASPILEGGEIMCPVDLLLLLLRAEDRSARHCWQPLHRHA